MVPTQNKILKAACLAFALLGSTAIVATIAAPDMAFAKGNGNGGGNGNGNGGGNGGDRGKGSTNAGKGGQTSNKGGSKASSKGSQGKKQATTAAASKKQKQVKQAAIEDLPVEEVEVTQSLSPKQKGKWNAANANQAALDAHIRNQNFNGTIGALAQYQLAARAAAGETLSEAELAALEGFVGPDGGPVDDAALSDYLNAGATDIDPVFSVEDGVVGCVANCDGVDLDAAQAVADAEAERLAAETQQTALDDFLTASEARIVQDSNKPLSPADTERLLDELAAALGVVRAPVIDEVVEETNTGVDGEVPVVVTGG